MCASVLPDVFWTVTLNESKYSIILEGVKTKDMMLWQRQKERERERKECTAILVRPSLWSPSRKRKTDSRFTYQIDRAALYTSYI